MVRKVYRGGGGGGYGRGTVSGGFQTNGKILFSTKGSFPKIWNCHPFENYFLNI